MEAAVRVIHGDCREELAKLAAGSFDAVVCDPPYPCIDRSYGYWTEAEWFELMDVVVPECRRVLKPTGSAVFILQPNSERVGRMRTWLLEFTLKWAKAWGQVQDAYWWNTSTLPLGGACKAGLMRGSVKACVWLGGPDCYRDQGAVLLSESASNRRDRAAANFGRTNEPSRRRSLTESHRDDKERLRTALVGRGGSTPFNVLPMGSSSPRSGGTHGHGAATPLNLCRWWTRYICPPGGRVLDPFAGSGTTLLAAEAEGRTAVGIEKEAAYVQIARKRLEKPVEDLGLLAGYE